MGAMRRRITLSIRLLALAAVCAGSAAASGDITVSAADRKLIDAVLDANEAALRRLGAVSYSFKCDHVVWSSNVGAWRDQREGEELVDAKGNRRFSITQSVHFTTEGQADAVPRFRRLTTQVISNDRYSASIKTPLAGSAEVFEHVSRDRTSSDERTMTFGANYQTPFFQHSFRVSDRSIRDMIWDDHLPAAQVLTAKRLDQAVIRIRRAIKAKDREIPLLEVDFDGGKNFLAISSRIYPGLPGDEPGEKVDIQLEPAGQGLWFPRQVSVFKGALDAKAGGGMTLVPLVSWKTTLFDVRIGAESSARDFSVDSLKWEEGQTVRWRKLSGQSERFAFVEGALMPWNEAEAQGAYPLTSAWLMSQTKRQKEAETSRPIRAELPSSTTDVQGHGPTGDAARPVANAASVTRPEPAMMAATPIIRQSRWGGRVVLYAGLVVGLLALLSVVRYSRRSKPASQ